MVQTWCCMLAARCVGPARGQAPAPALIGIGRLAYNYKISADTIYYEATAGKRKTKGKVYHNGRQTEIAILMKTYFTTAEVEQDLKL